LDFRERMHADLGAAVAGPNRGRSAADLLCQACVDLLEVDGAAISISLDVATRGTFASSNDLSRRLDELQFTFGEGPCMEAVAHGQPVLVHDLDQNKETRWPAFTGAVLDAGVRAVFALPVAISATTVGALDLFRHRPGGLTDDGLAGGLRAAELAAFPLLDLLADGGVDPSDGTGQQDTLERVEVYQATGMIMGHLNVDPTEAMARLRAYAFASGQTASEVAWSIVERRLVLESDNAWNNPGGSLGPPS
jgi:GAF domain/ANTAR domain